MRASKLIREGGLLASGHERVTSAYSYTSSHRPQGMTADKAARLYERLKPFLTAVRPRGMYLPPKFKGDKSGDLQDWPLSFRLRSQEIQWPVAITWKRGGKPITFAQFLEAYRITVTESRMTTYEYSQIVEEERRLAMHRRMAEGRV